MGRGRLSVGMLFVVLSLTGCGTASEEYDDLGIDELVIPTPSPDPEDFVDYVDNPWFPLEQGSTWTYDLEADGQVGESTVTVEPSNLLLGGVQVTSVRTATSLAGAPATETTDYYAQDQDGNVWWFGRAGEWDAEVADAEPGLAMPADPRVGDGWRLALLDGVVEDRATVESVQDGQVILRVESELTPGSVVQRTYDDEVGLIRSFNLAGPPGTAELTSGP